MLVGAKLDQYNLNLFDVIKNWQKKTHSDFSERVIFYS